MQKLMRLTGGNREVAGLWARFLESRDHRLRNLLVEAYLPLVRKIASEMAARLAPHVQADELEGAGVEGLIAAVENYDLSVGRTFRCYATIRIRGAMLDEVRKWKDRRLTSKAGRLYRAREYLVQSFGRLPSREEIAAHLGISLREVKVMESAAAVSGLYSVNETVCGVSEDEGEAEWLDTLAATEESPEKGVLIEDLIRIVHSKLSEQEKKVVALYYYEDLTFREIGEVLGITESRVSQIHSQLIRKLRKLIER